MEATDVLKVINGAGFIAVPMIAALFGLDWYFSRGAKSTKWIFIAIGGILSAVLYSYLAWTEPTMMLIRISILWYFGLAAAAVVVYYSIYVAYSGVADPPAPRWLLPVALLSYISLLSAIGLLCAAALARHDYLLVSGHISSGVEPLPNATVTLQDANYNSLRETLTDSKGRFLLTLKYKDYVDKPKDDQPAHLLIQADDFVEQNPDFDGHPNENMKFALVRR